MFRAIIIIAAGVLCMYGSPTEALTSDQVNVLNSGIYYFNTEADCGGIPTSYSSTLLTGNDNEQKAFNYFLSKGLSTMTTAAVVGNLMEESHLDPTIIQGGGHTNDPLTVMASGVGWGIAQWTPGAKIVGIAKGLDITGPIYELSTQLDIVWAEMTTTAPTGYRDVADTLKQQTDLSSATSFFQINFESGTNFDARYARAQEAFTLYGATAQATATTTGTAVIPLNTYLPANCGTTTTTPSGPTKQNIIWLQSGPSAEFDNMYTVANGCLTSNGAVIDPCTDPVTHIRDYWLTGQCSQASLAEVLNAYTQGAKLKTVTTSGGTSLAPRNGGTYYTTVDVERLSYTIHTWDGQFLFNGGMQNAWALEASLFHMKLSKFQIEQPGSDAAMEQELQAVINDANAGTPVITDAPDHWLVIWGGDANNVYLLDSSPHDETYALKSTNDSVVIGGAVGTPEKVSRAQFIHGLAGYADYWGGNDSGTGYDSAGGPAIVELTP